MCFKTLRCLFIFMPAFKSEDQGWILGVARGIHKCSFFPEDLIFCVRQWFKIANLFISLPPELCTVHHGAVKFSLLEKCQNSTLLWSIIWVNEKFSLWICFKNCKWNENHQKHELMKNYSILKYLEEIIANLKQINKQKSSN